jgi:hypothetical protein
VFLAVSVLFSTSGLAITIHTCFSSATKKVSVFISKECCKDDNSCKNEKEQPIDKLNSKCCSSTTSFLKVNSPFESLTGAKVFNASLPVFSNVINANVIQVAHLKPIYHPPFWQFFLNPYLTSLLI